MQVGLSPSIRNQRKSDEVCRSERLFDSHLHINDPRFPLVANTGCLPSTRVPIPFQDHDIETILETLGETAGEE
jgi:hypothetical protein